MHYSSKIPEDQVSHSTMKPTILSFLKSPQKQLRAQAPFPQNKSVAAERQIKIFEPRSGRLDFFRSLGELISSRTPDNRALGRRFNYASFLTTKATACSSSFCPCMPSSSASCFILASTSRSSLLCKKSMEQLRRNVILELLKAGHDGPSIIKVTKYAKATVHRVIARFKKEGVIERKPHERPRSKRTPELLAKLKRSIARNPGKSQAKQAKRWGVSEMTISKAVRFDLGLKSRARTVKHLITPKQKIARLAKSKKLLSSLKSCSWSRRKGSAAKALRFFSD